MALQFLRQECFLIYLFLCVFVQFFYSHIYEPLRIKHFFATLVLHDLLILSAPIINASVIKRNWWGEISHDPRLLLLQVKYILKRNADACWYLRAFLRKTSLGMDSNISRECKFIYLTYVLTGEFSLIKQALLIIFHLLLAVHLCRGIDLILWAV